MRKRIYIITWIFIRFNWKTNLLVCEKDPCTSISASFSSCFMSCHSRSSVCMSPYHLHHLLTHQASACQLKLKNKTKTQVICNSNCWPVISLSMVLGIFRFLSLNSIWLVSFSYVPLSCNCIFSLIKIHVKTDNSMEMYINKWFLVS